MKDFDYIFDEIDDVMIMTVEPGFGGQELKPEVIPKIRKTKRIIDDKGFDVEISVDGGVNEQTAPMLVDAEADTLIMGSAIFDEDRKFSIRELKNRFNA